MFRKLKSVVVLLKITVHVSENLWDNKSVTRKFTNYADKAGGINVTNEIFSDNWKIHRCTVR